MSKIKNIQDYHQACLRTVPEDKSCVEMLDNALLKSHGELGELFTSDDYPDRDEYSDLQWYCSLAWESINNLWYKYYNDWYTIRNRETTAKDYCYEMSKVLYDNEGKNLVNPSDWTKEKTFFKISKPLSQSAENFGKFRYHCEPNDKNKKRKYLNRIVKSFHDYECHLFLEAFRHDWPMVELWEENIEKLEDRYPNGFNPDNKQ